MQFRPCVPNFMLLSQKAQSFCYTDRKMHNPSAILPKYKGTVQQSKPETSGCFLVKSSLINIIEQRLTTKGTHLRTPANLSTTLGSVRWHKLERTPTTPKRSIMTTIAICYLDWPRSSSFFHSKALLWAGGNCWYKAAGKWSLLRGLETKNLLRGWSHEWDKN